MLPFQKNQTNSFFAFLSLPATAMGFALSVQIAALSWLLSTHYSLSIHEVGLVWAAGPIAGILGQVIIGIISDKVWFWGGRRRPFILIGGVLAALMLLALPNIGVISASLGLDGVMGVAIAVALMLDLAINVSFNPTRSIIADVTSEKNRTKGYTWMQTISGFFGVLAYLIGAVFGNFVLIYFGVFLVFAFSIFPTFFIEEPKTFINDETEENTQGVSDYGVGEILTAIKPLWGFLLYGVGGIVIKALGIKLTNNYFEIFCLIFGLIFLIQTFLQKSNTETQSNLHGFQKILGAHAFTWLGIQTMFVFMFAFIRYEFPEFADLTDKEMSKAKNNEIGSIINLSFLVFNFVAAILPALLLEPVTRKLGSVKTHYVCIASMSLSYLAILFFGYSSIALYVLMALAGIGWAATISLPFAIMSKKVNQQQMGLFMGLFNLSVVLPQLAVSLAIGKIIEDAQDKSIIFIICAVSLGISAILWTFIKDSDQKTPQNKTKSVSD